MNKKNMAVIGLLIVAMFAMVMPVEARIDLQVTNANLNTLKYGTNWYPYTYTSGDLAMWPGNFNTYGRSQIKINIVSPLGTIPAISIGTGECVAFVNALSNRNSISATDWRKGINVMSAPNIPPSGMIIATFRADGTYDTFGTNGKNHVAVFAGYQYDALLRRVGIFVWDQNFLPGYGKVVARHLISTTGTEVKNANNYYVVQGT